MTNSLHVTKKGLYFLYAIVGGMILIVSGITAVLVGMLFFFSIVFQIGVYMSVAGLIFFLVTIFYWGRTTRKIKK